MPKVSDGARTRDRRNHNPELYQLSYAHHEQRNLATPRQDRTGGHRMAHP